MEWAESFAGRRHRRDAGDLGGVVRPRLQVLQGEERRVVHAERVGRQRLRQALLEGLLLQLQEDAVRLLPLGFTLLRCLPPAPGTSRYPRFRVIPRESPGEHSSPWQRPAPAWAPLKHSLILKVLTRTKTGNPKSRGNGAISGKLWENPTGKQLGLLVCAAPARHPRRAARPRAGWHLASPNSEDDQTPPSQPWAILPHRARAETNAGGSKPPRQTPLLPLFSANASQASTSCAAPCALPRLPPDQSAFSTQAVGPGRRWLTYSI